MLAVPPPKVTVGTLIAPFRVVVPPLMVRVPAATVPAMVCAPPAKVRLPAPLIALAPVRLYVPLKLSPAPVATLVGTARMPLPFKVNVPAVMFRLFNAAEVLLNTVLMVPPPAATFTAPVVPVLLKVLVPVPVV